MELRNINMTFVEGGTEVELKAFVPSYNVEDIAGFFAGLDVFTELDADTAPDAGTDPDDGGQDSKEYNGEEISDVELLTAVASAAEKIGPEKAKEIVKRFAIGRGRPTVKNIPADKRRDFIAELKAAMTLASEPDGDPADDEPPEDKPEPSGSRRRRN